MKYLNWGALTDDLLEILVMNQTQLAKQCRVTQQSVSNWKTGVRSPGVYARHVLRELAKEAKVTLDDYKTIPYQKPVGKPANEGGSSAVSEDIMNFAQRLSILPKRQREKIMDMAEFMISRGN